MCTQRCWSGQGSVGLCRGSPQCVQHTKYVQLFYCIEINEDQNLKKDKFLIITVPGVPSFDNILFDQEFYKSENSQSPRSHSHFLCVTLNTEHCRPLSCPNYPRCQTAREAASWSIRDCTRGGCSLTTTVTHPQQQGQSNSRPPIPIPPSGGMIMTDADETSEGT